MALSKQQEALVSMWMQIRVDVFFKQEGATPTLNGKALKFVEQLMHLGNNISSTENDVSICIAKYSNSLVIIWISYLSNKIKISSKLWLCEYYCMDAPDAQI